MNARHLLWIVAVLLLTLPALAQPSTLPNGVAAGDTDQTSTVLWARSTTFGAITFTVMQGDSVFTEVTAEVIDPTEPVKVEIGGLTPGTAYTYTVTDAAGTSQTGRFSTPAELGTRDGLRFGVTGDWRGELAPFPAIRNAADRDLDFFVLHGDTVYADVPSVALPIEQARTLEEYRLKHDEVYGERYGFNFWADLRASTSIYATIDDHEVTNDFAGAAAPTRAVYAGDPAEMVNDTELYENGLQAFHEYNPIREEYYGDTGDPRTANERKLYRYRTFGSDAALFMLDARSFRDVQLEPVEDITNTVAALAYLTQTYDDSRTMLGAVQLETLKADLLRAQSDGILWKFVMVSQPVQNFGILNAGDRFEGYAAERTDLLRFIDENDIRNVVFVAADFHGTITNNLVYKPGPLADPVPLPSFEIVTGSVAYYQPFGQTLIELARDLDFIDQATYDAYLASDLVEREALVESLINPQLEPLDYPLLGLDNADLLDVELVQGSYLSSHSFGWTEFEINAETGALRVITYGIPPYSQRDLEANPDAVLSRQPAIMGEFVVQPQ